MTTSTKPVPTTQPTPKPSVELTPTISVNGKLIKFTEQTQTLLECLEQANVEVHYHCRDGFCGACRTTLTSGDVYYPKGQPVAYIGTNEILPCCCLPITNLTLNIK